ncbi:MAG: sulfatase-like hydrolase/transferase [Syntrophotaleaceae bacterium]
MSRSRWAPVSSAALYGDKRGLTPAFDQLATEGLRFSNAFATGTRTVRGLEAISLSLPPIPSESVIKRPGCEGLASWGQVMEDHGYRSSFLYGGYGYFDNMNHFFGSNGFALSDSPDIVAPWFTNVWGVRRRSVAARPSATSIRSRPAASRFFPSS